ncbi:hypothetical protein DFO67_12447 [Modicisalibacter xianhensis]|uniref:Uncharacterized protein n=1 Tax=Modicisalibacter xianhensis TaxID=442341 RepID=A0A4R8FD40_9GAMM|nr:hypothetical protein [Halomonas xianhensis]TDX23730.1 hypothetical protein DFO67_12447 [Halomonas xianhensis]
MNMAIAGINVDTASPADFSLREGELTAGYTVEEVCLSVDDILSIERSRHFEACRNTTLSELEEAMHAHGY